MTARKMTEIYEHEDDEYGADDVQETVGGRKFVKLSEKLQMAYDSEDVAITVHRKAKRGKSHAFLFEVDEFEDLPALQAKLRDEYGGGEFQIEGRRENGSWAFKDTLIVEPPKSVSEKEHHGTGDFQSVLLAMQQSADKSAREFREMAQNQQQQMMAMQQQNMDMVLKMMMAGQSQPRDSMGLNEVLTLMTTLKSLEPPKQDNFELFMKGLEFGRESGGGGDENVLQTALKTFGGPLAKMTEQLAAQQAAPAPAQYPQQHAPAHSEDETDMLEIMRLKPDFEKLTGAAMRGEDINTWVSYAMQNVDHNLLGKYVCDPQQYARLYSFAPGMAQIRPWLDTFREQVIDCFQRESFEPRPLPGQIQETKPKTVDFYGGDTKAHVHERPPIPSDSAHVSGETSDTAADQ